MKKNSVTAQSKKVVRRVGTSQSYTAGAPVPKMAEIPNSPDKKMLSSNYGGAF